MTRKKKSRSLKRIHQVKTGSRSKLQKSTQTDRQHKSRFKTDKKQKSIFALHQEALKNEENQEQESRVISQERTTTATATPKSPARSHQSKPKAATPKNDAARSIKQGQQKESVEKPSVWDNFEKGIHKDIF